jgi:hypothetical protein
MPIPLIAPLPPGQDRQAIFQVERGVHALEPGGESELYHREGHLRLDAHEHDVGAPELGGVGDAAEESRSVTSTTTPRLRNRPTRSSSASCKLRQSASLRVD